jgi:hypothetical protein
MELTVAQLVKKSPPVWNTKVHCRVLRNAPWEVPCHHGKARPEVSDGEGFQIQILGANISNKQSRTADNGWFSSLGATPVANKSLS